MDPAGRGVMWQRFGENVVLVAAPNEGTPEKHGRAIYLSQPVRERRSRLPLRYMCLFRCTSHQPGHAKLVGVRSTRNGSRRGYGAKYGGAIFLAPVDVGMAESPHSRIYF